MLGEFHLWREREEEVTYTTYVKGQQTYHPLGTGIHKISNTTAVQIQKCFVYYMQTSCLGTITRAVEMASTEKIKRPDTKRGNVPARRKAGS